MMIAGLFVGAICEVAELAATSWAAPVDATPAVGCPAGKEVVRRLALSGSESRVALTRAGVEVLVDGEVVTRIGSVALGTVPGMLWCQRSTNYLYLQRKPFPCAVAASSHMAVPSGGDREHVVITLGEDEQ